MVVVKVFWTKSALLNLEAELDYYGQINQDLAKELSIIVRDGIEKIQFMPGLGRAGKKIGHREYVLQKYPYIIAYRMRNSVLEILAIVHQQRKNIRSFY